MRLISIVISFTSSLVLAGCACKGTNPVDPFEPFNRKVYKFNTAFDNVFLKPPAKVYRAVVPAPVRKSVNNFYNNLDLIPTVGNDLLQAKGKWAIRDSWRFIINSSLGVGGLFDVAKTFGLPPHSNDLGLTLAKWGDKNSPYLVIPLLGPSTLRDGAGWLFQFALYSPYVYIHNDTVVYSLLALRYVDLRSQLLDTDRIMDEALDKYSFMRDAYLQYRNNLIADNQADTGTLYVDDKKADQKVVAEIGSDYVDE
ncbi:MULTISPECIES: VacJ family lipoprotein [Legionella]|uniref:Lipoprotein VacJ-like protein n=1 Tax=Legionella steelei TaxID=947033 RepID=A0A0W0ZDZ2_9GAMM|nr:MULTISPECIES: VacJ family lipoprotein [Legionella]KTD67273.1 lipoprotein VacJ-like protein [Legionella steelei]MBN9228816.1 VacJ family lipoprotein [Legionella steelei]OJW16201.1 MAG: ABC transporter [Legionella sp. 39-23]